MTMNEKRSKKYPDTDTFHFHNANPKGKMTTDCVVRAISTALRQPYNQTLMEMAEMTIKTGYMYNENKGIDKYMQSKGWVKCKAPRKEDGSRYTGREFCRKLMHPIYSEELDMCSRGFEINSILANIGSHHTIAIMSGQIWDTWDSGSGAIGVVWVKPT